MNQCDFSFSTSWNAGNVKSGNEIVRQIKKLGINKIELNFTISGRKLDEIIKLYNKNYIKISSVHNYCPVPEDIEKQRVRGEMT